MEKITEKMRDNLKKMAQICSTNALRLSALENKTSPASLLQYFSNPRPMVQPAQNGQLEATAQQDKCGDLRKPIRPKEDTQERRSDYEDKALAVINSKKMRIMECYLRFMRLVHIGNGLDMHWRKVVTLDMDTTFDQFYEMIEYKTSELLVFVIDCLCILHDVGLLPTAG